MYRQLLRDDGDCFVVGDDWAALQVFAARSGGVAAGAFVAAEERSEGAVIPSRARCGSTPRWLTFPRAVVIQRRLCRAQCSRHRFVSTLRQDDPRPDAGYSKSFFFFEKIPYSLFPTRGLRSGSR